MRGGERVARDKDALGKIKIKRLPKLGDTARLSHRKVVKLLHLCPLSRNFGRDVDKILVQFPTKKKALEELHSLIKSWNNYKALP